MRRRRIWLTLPLLAAGLAFVVPKPANEVDGVLGTVPELALVAHERAQGGEAWLFTGRAPANVIAQRLEEKLKGRPGWIMPLRSPAAPFVYSNHYAPLAAPRWFDRFAFLHIPDRRRLIDVQAMVGRAIRGDRQEVPHGPNWTTVRVSLHDYRMTAAGVAPTPFEEWVVYR